MQIGEKLIRDGLISVSQLHGALQSQIALGGRLGSNLIRMGAIKADTFSKALSELLQVDAAKISDFKGIQTVTLRLVNKDLVTRRRALPLREINKDELLVAFVQPLDDNSRREFARVSKRVIRPAVASEITILDFIERLYGVKLTQPQPERMPDLPSCPVVELPENSEVVAPEPPPIRQVSAQPRRSSVIPLRQPRQASVVPSNQPAPRQASVGQPAPRASVVPTPAARTSSVTVQPVPPVIVGQPLKAPLPEPEVPAPTFSSIQPAQTETSRPALGVDDAIKQIGTATSSDLIGDAIVDYLRSAFSCGLIVLVRDGMALGWKGFSGSTDSSAIESITVPLSAPSMFAEAHERKSVFRGAPPEAGMELQRRLWKLLRCTEPSEVVVVPILLQDRVVNLIYAHPFAGGIPNVAADELMRITSEASKRFLSLIAEARKSKKPVAVD